MIKEKDVLCLEEFMDKYKEDIKNGNITDEIKENAIATLMSHNEFLRWKYKDKIKRIFISIIEVTKIEYPNGHIEAIYDLVNAIRFLKSDISFYNNDYWNLDDLCKEAYDELLKSSYHEYMDLNIGEEYSSDHIFDIPYYMDLFIKNSTNNKFIEKAEEYKWRYQ